MTPIAVFPAPHGRKNSSGSERTIIQRHLSVPPLIEGGFRMVSGGFWDTVKVAGGPRETPLNAPFPANRRRNPARSSLVRLQRGYR